MWNVSTNIMLRPQDMPLIDFAEEYDLDIEIEKSLDEPLTAIKIRKDGMVKTYCYDEIVHDPHHSVKMIIDDVTRRFYLNKKGEQSMCRKSNRYYDWEKELIKFAEEYGLTIEIERTTCKLDTARVTFRNAKNEKTYEINVKYPSYVKDLVTALKSGLIAFWELKPVTKSGAVPFEGNHLPAIRNVYFNDPVTVVIWADGTKTIVRCENETYDREKGLAMCISKKALGNKPKYYDTFKYWFKRDEEIV